MGIYCQCFFLNLRMYDLSERCVINVGAANSEFTTQTQPRVVAAWNMADSNGSIGPGKLMKSFQDTTLYFAKKPPPVP